MAEKKKRVDSGESTPTKPNFPSPYIEVVVGYRGRSTREQYIEPKIYFSGDEALHGQERFLVLTKRARWTRQRPPENLVIEDEVWDDPEATAVVEELANEDPFSDEEGTGDEGSQEPQG